MKMNFESIFDFAEKVLTVYGDTCADTSVYINTEDAMDFIRELIGQNYLDEDDLYIEAINVDPYEDFEVALITIDKQGGIWAEDAACDSGLKRVESLNVFVEPEFYRDVEKANGSATNYLLFTIGEKEEETNGKVGWITDDSGKICGFAFDDDRDGACFHCMMCECKAPDNPDKIMRLWGKIVDAYAGILS